MGEWISVGPDLTAFAARPRRSGPASLLGSPFQYHTSYLLQCDSDVRANSLTTSTMMKRFVDRGAAGISRYRTVVAPALHAMRPRRIRVVARRGRDVARMQHAWE